VDVSATVEMFGMMRNRYWMMRTIPGNSGRKQLELSKRRGLHSVLINQLVNEMRLQLSVQYLFHRNIYAHRLIGD
jgi:hypothetical protein